MTNYAKDLLRWLKMKEDFQSHNNPEPKPENHGLDRWTSEAVKLRAIKDYENTKKQEAKKAFPN